MRVKLDVYCRQDLVKGGSKCKSRWEERSGQRFGNRAVRGERWWEETVLPATGNKFIGSVEPCRHCPIIIQMNNSKIFF